MKRKIHRNFNIFLIFVFVVNVLTLKYGVNGQPPDKHEHDPKFGSIDILTADSHGEVLVHKNYQEDAHPSPVNTEAVKTTEEADSIPISSTRNTEISFIRSHDSEKDVEANSSSRNEKFPVSLENVKVLSLEYNKGESISPNYEVQHPGVEDNQLSETTEIATNPRDAENTTNLSKSKYEAPIIDRKASLHLQIDNDKHQDVLSSESRGEGNAKTHLVLETIENVSNFKDIDEAIVSIKPKKVHPAITKKVDIEASIDIATENVKEDSIFGGGDEKAHLPSVMPGNAEKLTLSTSTTGVEPNVENISKVQNNQVFLPYSGTPPFLENVETTPILNTADKTAQTPAMDTDKLQATGTMKELIPTSKNDAVTYFITLENDSEITGTVLSESKEAYTASKPGNNEETEENTDGSLPSLNNEKQLETVAFKDTEKINLTSENMTLTPQKIDEQRLTNYSSSDYSEGIINSNESKKTGRPLGNNVEVLPTENNAHSTVGRGDEAVHLMPSNTVLDKKEALLSDDKTPEVPESTNEHMTHPDGEETLLAIKNIEQNTISNSGGEEAPFIPGHIEEKKTDRDKGKSLMIFEDGGPSSSTYTNNQPAPISRYHEVLTSENIGAPVSSRSRETHQTTLENIDVPESSRSRDTHQIPTEILEEASIMVRTVEEASTSEVTPFYTFQNDDNFTSKLEFSISARHLSGISSTCKTYVQLFDGGNNPKWIEYHKTETVLNNRDPNFETKLVIPFKFGARQMVKFEIYGIDTNAENLNEILLGFATCSVSLLIHKGRGKVELDLQDESLQPTRSVIIIHVLDLPVPRSNVQVIVEMTAAIARKFTPLSWFGAKPPNLNSFVEIYRAFDDDSNDNVPVHETETVRTAPSPSTTVSDLRWKRFSLLYETLSGGDHDQRLKFICRKTSPTGEHVTIGEFETTLKQLRKGMRRFPLIHPQSKKKLNDSWIDVEHFHVCSFVNYVMGGLKIQTMIGIDFSDNNDFKEDQSSLHNVDPLTDVLNVYEEVISSIVPAMEEYTEDKNVPIYGFPGFSPVSETLKINPMIYHVNLNPKSAACTGLDGILAAYRSCLLQVARYHHELNLIPIIEEVINLAVKNPKSYHILSILTTGDLFYPEYLLGKTMEAIKNASHHPVSIIIVGMGDRDFEILESIRANAKTLERDIVTFLPLKNFVSRDLTIDRLRFTEEVLANVPGQLVSYMFQNNSPPKDPPSDQIYLHPNRDH